MNTNRQIKRSRIKASRREARWELAKSDPDRVQARERAEFRNSLRDMGRGEFFEEMERALAHGEDLTVYQQVRRSH